MSDTPADNDLSQVRRRFERVSGERFIFREISRRMQERLDLVKNQPLTVIDAGCGDGSDFPVLAAKYAGATLIGLDLAYRPLLLGADAERGRQNFLQRLLKPQSRAIRVQADMGCGCFRPASVDMIWSNLALPWHPDPAEVMRQWASQLRPDGLLFFSSLGPDTLKEVRSLLAQVDDDPHVGFFVDMHDLGDMLVAAGMAAPVMDMELLKLTYRDPNVFWRDVRQLGGLATRDRFRGLRGRRWKQRLDEAIRRQLETGELTLTLEIVYGHAWKGTPRIASDGRPIVQLPASRSKR